MFFILLAITLVSLVWLHRAVFRLRARDRLTIPAPVEPGFVPALRTEEA